MDLTFTGGSVADTMMCLTVTISNDDRVENDETFLVILTLVSSGVELGQTTVTILDDDGKVFLMLDTSTKR